MTDPKTGDPDDPNATARYATPEPTDPEPPPAVPEPEPPPAVPSPEPQPPPTVSPEPTPSLSSPSPVPSWQPKAADQGRTASVLFGFVILAIGLWFFADHTLGLQLPRIRWNQLWPIVLIVIGAWIALGSMRRRSP